MAKDTVSTPRLERIRAARVKLQGMIDAKHPKSKAFAARIAEYDAAEEAAVAKLKPVKAGR